MKLHAWVLLLMVGCAAHGQNESKTPTQQQRATSARRPDAIEDAQTPRAVAQRRPEQAKTEKDDPARFKADKAQPSSEVLKDQPDQGKILGFDLARDPLNAKKPMEKAEEITAKDIADKPGVMDAQKQLLESRYNLTPKFDNAVKMSRGKPLAVGPTAKLKGGKSWEDLGQMSPEDIK